MLIVFLKTEGKATKRNDQDGSVHSRTPRLKGRQ